MRLSALVMMAIVFVASLAASLAPGCSSGNKSLDAGVDLRRDAACPTAPALLDPVATTHVHVRGNLRGNVAPPTAFNPQFPEGTSNTSTTFEVYDSLGATHDTRLYFRLRSAGLWEWYALVDGGGLAGGNPGDVVVIFSGTLLFDTNGTFTGSSSMGSFTPINAATPQTVGFDFGSLNVAPKSDGGVADAGTTVLSAITQFATPTALVITQDGHSVISDPCLMIDMKPRDAALPDLSGHDACVVPDMAKDGGADGGPPGAPQATTYVALRGNLNAQAAVLASAWNITHPGATANGEVALSVYDSLGALHALKIFFRHTAQGAWDWHTLSDGAGLTGGTGGGNVEVAGGSLMFDTMGRLTQTSQTVNAFAPNGAAPQSLAFIFGDPTALGGSGFAGLTQYASDFKFDSVTQNGHAAGNLCP